MGDVLELTTWPGSQNAFYKITTNCFRFEVKGDGNAKVCLAAQPNGIYFCAIVIGDHGNMTCKIQIDARNDEFEKSVNVPNVLDGNEYRRFWIKWSLDCVKLGRDGDPKEIIAFMYKLPPLNYVKFQTMSEEALHWKINLPPQRQPNILKAIQGGAPQWVAVDDQIPEGALIGGYENGKLYIIKAKHRGSVTPGKFIPFEGLAYIPWGGQAHEKEEFEVLCGYNMYWKAMNGDNIPFGAIEGGYTEDNGEKLFIGRAMHENNLIPGKVQPSHRCCYIPHNDMEIAKTLFEVLIDPNLSNRSVSSTV